MTKPKKASGFGMNKMLVYQMIALVAIVLAFIAGNYFFKKSLHTVMKAPNFELIDQNNRRISNTDMLGKVYVVEFFYARCPTICPIMNNNLIIPFYFSLKDGEPFGFAGLWDRWADKANPGESALTTCTIITCAANALVADVHERMPVILSGDRMWQWLQAESEVEALSLLRPVDPTLMRAWQVSRRVNDVSNDDPAILEAV